MLNDQEILIGGQLGKTQYAWHQLIAHYQAGREEQERLARNVARNAKRRARYAQKRLEAMIPDPGTVKSKGGRL